MSTSASVLVYSHDRSVRASVIRSLGTTLEADLPELEFHEVATEPIVVAQADTGKHDLLILDGEANPAGGIGICRALKDEIFNCPPILVIIGRPQDAWLATWSRADAIVGHPVDPIHLAEAVAGLLRQPQQLPA